MVYSVGNLLKTSPQGKRTSTAGICRHSHLCMVPALGLPALLVLCCSPSSACLEAEHRDAESIRVHAGSLRLGRKGCVGHLYQQLYRSDLLAPVGTGLGHSHRKRARLLSAQHQTSAAESPRVPAVQHPTLWRPQHRAMALLSLMHCFSEELAAQEEWDQKD